MKRYAIMTAVLLALPAHGMAQGDGGEQVSPADVHHFITHSGVNLPWSAEDRYGWDFGVNPWGGEISDKPTFFGEIAPGNVVNQLNSALENGYKGVLFWSLNKDYDFRAVATAYSDWVTARFVEVHEGFSIADMRVGGQPATVELDIVPTYPGGSYRVEGCHDLRDGNWQTIESFRGQAEAGATTGRLPSTSTTRMFYRVKAEF